MVTGLDRRAAVAALLAERGTLLAVSGLGSPSYDLHAAGDDAGNFYLWGAMGGAAMVGLGLARARPDRPVLVVTGDGEALMGLGALATIGAAKPANLSVVVLDNGRFGETGMQESHSARGVDLVAVARACGFAWAEDISEDAALPALRARLHEAAGPGFARIAVRAEPLPRSLPSRDGAWLKARFRAGLGMPPV